MNPTAINPAVCLRPKCGHRWYPRTPERPAVCPRCHSPLWDRLPKSKPAKQEAAR